MELRVCVLLVIGKCYYRSFKDTYRELELLERATTRMLYRKEANLLKQCNKQFYKICSNSYIEVLHCIYCSYTRNFFPFTNVPD